MDVMVDLETMGTRPGSAIASIGAVAFDPVAGVIGEASFYRTISLASCQQAGLVIDGDTVGWWLQRGDEARAALLAGAAPLAGVLQHFAAWWRMSKGGVIWGHGGNFDEPMLSAAYEAVGHIRPWHYADGRCTRTIFAAAKVTPDRAQGVHHNALDDARAQAVAVCRAYDALGLSAAAMAETSEGADAHG